MNSPTKPRSSHFSLLFEVLQLALIVLMPTLFVYWTVPTLTLHFLVVWGGLSLFIVLLQLLRRRR